MVILATSGCGLLLGVGSGEDTARDGGARDATAVDGADREGALPDASSPGAAQIWTFHGGATDGWAGAYAVAVDERGNVYLTGEVAGPSPAIGETPIDGTGAFLVLSLDPTGLVRWWRRFGVGFGSAIDARGGLVCAGGTLAGATTIGSLALAATLGEAAVVVCFGDEGTPRWAAIADYDGDDRIGGVAIDATGNVYAAGSIFQAASFPDGRATGTPVAMIASWTPSGVARWRHDIGAAGRQRARAIAVDGERVVVTGEYFGASALEGLSASRDNDVWIASLGLDGTFGWVTRIGATSTDRGAGLAMRDGVLLVTGVFAGSGFGPTDATISIESRGDGDLFYGTLDAATGQVTGLVGGGSALLDWASEAAFVQRGAVVVGWMSGPGVVGGVTTTHAGDRDMLVARIDEMGGVEWAIPHGGPLGDGATSVASTPDGSAVWIVGQFAGTASIAGTTLTATGVADAIVLRLEVP